MMWAAAGALLMLVVIAVLFMLAMIAAWNDPDHRDWPDENFWEVEDDDQVE